MKALKRGMAVEPKNRALRKQYTELASKKKAAAAKEKKQYAGMFSSQNAGMFSEDRPKELPKEEDKGDMMHQVHNAFSFRHQDTQT